MSDLSAAPRLGGLRSFFDRGGFWRLVPLVVVYLAIYLGAGLLATTVFARQGEEELLTTVGSVFVDVTFALIVGAVVLGVFLWAMGWTREVFGPQPIGGSRWMWIGPTLVTIPIVLRIIGPDYGKYSLAVIVLTIVTGLLVGLVEEVLTRGIAVKMLRDAGHSERVVALVSSLVFAALHSVNLLSGQAVTTVGVTMAYTFGFGVCMYLTMRVTRSIIPAIVLHGLTDPFVLLSTGGIDEVGSNGTQNALLTVAGSFSFIIIVAGLVMVWFVRGRVAQGTDGTVHDPVSATKG